MTTLAQKTGKSTLAELHQNAACLLDARARGLALAEFPGELPSSLHDAYLIQDHAILQRGGEIAGWKVGFIAPERRDEDGDERVLGPIFTDLLAHAQDGERLPWRFVAGGFAAVEAEYVFCLRSQLDLQATADETALQNYVASVHVGVELAGSALRSINKIGPLAVASDFGNNNGLILGPALALDLHRLAQPETWQSLLARTVINGREVGLGGAAHVPGTPWRAFVFALRRLLQRGYPLPAGTLIATGASTGIHDVEDGDEACLEFWSEQSPEQRVRLGCKISHWRGM
jgi:2-keto-4-pentenoate hydratase